MNRTLPAVSTVYIGGCQRSGSTLLDRILSQVPGHVSAGEVVHLWSRGLRDNELCGCGRAFHDCPFWAAVGKRAFGGWKSLDAQAIVRLQRTVDRNRYIPLMIAPWLSPRFRRRLHTYTGMLERLYRAIGEVAEGATVVDSSKHPSTAFLLRQVPSVELRIVHLVRDARGVAYSLLKRIRRPEAADAPSLMYRSTPARSGLEWLAFNLAFHVLRSTGVPSVLVRYENLVSDPRPELERIVKLEGLRMQRGDLGFLSGDTVTLAVDHTVSGNPMRFTHGSFALKVDDAWRGELAAGGRRLTTALTWPLLIRYGYLVRRTV